MSKELKGSIILFFSYPIIYWRNRIGNILFSASYAHPTADGYVPTFIG